MKQINRKIYADEPFPIPRCSPDIVVQGNKYAENVDPCEITVPNQGDLSGPQPAAQEPTGDFFLPPPSPPPRDLDPITFPEGTFFDPEPNFNDFSNDSSFGGSSDESSGTSDNFFGFPGSGKNPVGTSMSGDGVGDQPGFAPDGGFY